MKTAQWTSTLSLLLVMGTSLFAGVTHEVSHSKVFGTISKALVKARPGDTILVADGLYKDQLFITTGVVVKTATPQGATINGGGRGVVVTMGSSSEINGFIIKNGTIGVFSKVTSATIKNCHIIENWMTGVMVVRHLPLIEDNVIAFNRGSGFVGWDVRTTDGNMYHNTIAYNVGHGLFIGGKSKVKASYNTIAFNQKFGLTISDASGESTIEANNFWANLRQDLPSNNFTFDPAFMSARVNLDFRSDKTLCCSATDNGVDLGARNLKSKIEIK